MDRRALLLALLPTLVAGPALASGDKKEKEGEPKQEIGQYVDLQPVALPIVVKGQLVNYVFVSVRIVLTSSANVSKIRQKEPYFRDALVKAAHRNPFTKPDDYLTIDSARLQSTLKADAIALVGASNIKGVVISSQTPKRRIGMPGAGGRRDSGEIHP